MRLRYIKLRIRMGVRIRSDTQAAVTCLQFTFYSLLFTVYSLQLIVYSYRLRSKLDVIL